MGAVIAFAIAAFFVWHAMRSKSKIIGFALYGLGVVFGLAGITALAPDTPSTNAQTAPQPSSRLAAKPATSGPTTYTFRLVGTPDGARVKIVRQSDNMILTGTLGSTFELEPGQYKYTVTHPEHKGAVGSFSIPKNKAIEVKLAYIPPKPDLEVLSVDAEADSFTRYATGRIRNNTDRTYSYVQVMINLYDSSGAVVGSTMDNLNNLKPGQTWKFKAPILDDSATRFSVEDVTGF